MKKFSLLIGASLLETMLVLVLMSFLILLSIKYYKSAQLSTMSTDMLNKITVITASADQLAQPNNSYANITASQVQDVSSNSSLLDPPWGGAITITGQSATGYTVNIPNTPPGVCQLLKAKLLINPKFSASGNTCGTNTTITFTYTYTYNAL
jgi:hypothetical protein